MSIGSEIMYITPEMAKRWLEDYNPHNRRVYQPTVEAYARDIRDNNWSVNNQGIGFDERGDLLDGQHRLHAILRAGMGIWSLVVRGLPAPNGGGPNVQMTIDQGKPRTAGDVLTLAHNVENGNTVAAIVRIIAVLCTRGRTKWASKLSANTINNIRILYEEEIEAVLSIKHRNIRGLYFAPILGAFVFAAKPYRNEIADFLPMYYSGENLVEGHPALTLREYRMKSIGQRGSGGSTFRYLTSTNALNCLWHYVRGSTYKRCSAGMYGVQYFADYQKEAVDLVLEILDI